MKAAVKSHNVPRQRATFRAGRIATACALALALAACNGHGRRDVAGWLDADPTQNHPIIIDRKEVVLELAVPAGSYGLTHNQKNDLRTFAARFRKEDSGGVLVVSTPSGGANEIAAMRATGNARRVIGAAGVPKAETAFETYAAGGLRAAPLRISFLRHVAQPPVCGDWPKNLAHNRKNLPYHNMGCATQRNLAAMVSNPRDLVEPRTMTPRSSERRDTIWDKYVKGETTIAEKADEEKTTVSEVEGGN